MKTTLPQIIRLADHEVIEGHNLGGLKDYATTEVKSWGAEQLSRLTIPPKLNNCLSGSPAGATS